MPFSHDFAEHVCELLAPLGTIRIQRMFGGAGVYCDDLTIALIVDDVLYLKADAHNRTDFEDNGCPPFSYTTKRGTVQLSYFQVPDEAMDSPALMELWARGALGAAVRARKPTTRKLRFAVKT